MSKERDDINGKLSDMVDKHFGVHVAGHGHSINVTLIPGRVVDVTVPVEYVMSVNNAIECFNQYVAAACGIRSILQKYHLERNTPETRERIRCDIQKAISAFEAMSGIVLKDVLKATLGIEPYLLRYPLARHILGTPYNKMYLH